MSGVNELLYHVALAAKPRARCHRVGGALGWPQAESVVMLGRQHRLAEARALECRHPLDRIERRGIEEHRARGAVALLLVAESIHAEMQEGSELLPLPRELIRRGKWWNAPGGTL